MAKDETRKNKSMGRREFFSRAFKGAGGLIGSITSVAAEGVESKRKSTRRPNFVFILMDDMGWRDLSCYGSTFYETPNIDRVAAEGMKFTQAYAACPVCSPTRASIMTGRYPARLHLTDWIPGHPRRNAKLRVPEFNQQLPLEEVTIAEALKSAGYATASIGKWHLGGEGFGPEVQGFDVNFGGTHQGLPPSYFYPYKIPNIETGEEGEYLTDRLTNEALKFIEDNKEQPFFLFLSHYAVHTPLAAPKDLIAKYEAKVEPGREQNNATYAAMIESVDAGVGRIIAKLDELDITDNTVVIFTSDNGGLADVTSNSPLRAGKGTLYEGGIREPLIVKWPGVVHPGRTSDAVVTSTDFYPTILRIADIERPTGPVIDGMSFDRVLRATGTFRRDAIYWHYPHYHTLGATPGGAIVRGPYKLIEFFEDNHVELYHLGDDIGEKNNLAEEQPEMAEQLREMLADWRKYVGASMPTPNPDYDPSAA